MFISSTFRDMQAERDRLVKQVFPELRRRCRERRVEFVEVDLRWGVTEEQAERGEVLPICLAEIENCRPYFVGLLGERYGWVPDHLPDELLEREPWLEQQGRRSVTELEILHGVLNNPGMAHRAYFYFRDPAYLGQVLPERRTEFGAESPAASERLAALKARIRASGFPVLENYADPESVGQRILNDLWAAVDADFPAGPEPDPLGIEAAEHEAFAQSRARVYIDRPEWFARLDRQATGADAPLTVVGESGCGKSALLANWALRWRSAHPDDLVLLHFVGSSRQSTDWAAMLRRLMGELARRFAIRGEIPEKPEDLREAFANWLNMAAARGRVVLVLDALNQLEDREGAPDLVWLPERLPANVRLLLASLPGRSLQAIVGRGWPTFGLAPLDAGERRKVIEATLSRYHKRLSEARATRIAEAPACGNPLYLRALLEELRVFGVHEQLDQRIDYYLQAPDAASLYARILPRLEQDYEQGRPGLVREALALLWASRRGLTQNELLELLGSGQAALPRALWSPLYLALQESLISRSGRLGFFHDYLRQAVKARYLPGEAEQQAAHRRLASYWAARPLDERKADEWLWQLAQTQAWQELYEALRDPALLACALRHAEMEVEEYWHAVEVHLGASMVEAYASVRQNPGGTPWQAWDVGSLLQRHGHVDEAEHVWRGLAEHFRRAGDLADQARALTNLANNLRIRGRYDEAVEQLNDARRAGLQTGDQAGAAAAMLEQASVLLELRRLEPCLRIASECEAYYRSAGNPAGLAGSLGCQALALQFKGDLARASVLLREQARLYQQVGDHAGLAGARTAQAEIASRTGDLAGAMALLEQNREMFERAGNLRGLAQMAGQRAVILRAWGRLDEAMRLLQRQEELNTRLGARAGVAKALGNQAVVLTDRGRLREALDCAQRQGQIARELGDLGELQLSLNNQALIAQAAHDLEGAWRLLQEKEQISRSLDDPAALASCLNNQASVLIQMGRLDEAWARLEEKESLCRKLDDKAGLASTYGNQALIREGQGQPQVALALHQQAYSLYRQLQNPRGMAQALLAQGVLLAGALNDAAAAQAALSEALKLAREYGFEGLARRIESALAKPR